MIPAYSRSRLVYNCFFYNLVITFFIAWSGWDCMRLEQLQYFVQVVESHSFNRAAQHLNITQPALTNSIRALEEELGVQLLIRSRRGCVPTSWGGAHL